MKRSLKLWVYIFSFILINSISCFAQIVGEHPSAISSYEFTRMDSGVEIAILHPGKGDKISVGDIVKVHMTGSILDGTEFYSTIKKNKPVSVIAGIGKLIAGLDEGLQQLNKGSKAIFKIPAAMGYGEQGYGNIVPPNSDLIFTVEVIEIQSNPNPVNPFNVDGKEMVNGKNSLKYIYVKKLESVKAGTGDSVWVHYIGYLPDGRIFDTSLANKEPFSFKLGDPQIIKGWNKGIALMRIGEKIRFIIPWKMGYGKDGMPPKIPPKTDLTFDIELVKIKSNK